MSADKVQGALQHSKYPRTVWDFFYTTILLSLLIMFYLPSHRHLNQAEQIKFLFSEFEMDQKFLFV